MTKVRPPKTIEAALWRAKDNLGLEALADICGKSESMITKYMDRDCELHHLPAKYIVAIDQACKEETGETPIASVINGKLEGVRGKIGTCIMDDLTCATIAFGKLAETVRAAKAPTGPGGQRVTNRELQALEEGISVLKRKLEGMEATAQGQAVSFKAVS
ncbi:hypothetical protein [Sneathiella glossodoripedis]|uniref:hypothetical protein n=1 Tax=Sneathiella glossodoripedis TaxID=418853 RepID=UPI000471100E|nr:hypothetical protein [Sneathiella glossodoripedis]